MRPVPIPKGMGFLEGETKTIRGGDSGAEDVECSVGVTPEGTPFFAYLVSLSVDDLRSLHLDPRLWVIQLGSLSLFPHAFATAFQSPEYEDRTTQSIDTLAELVSQVTRARLIDDAAAVDELLAQIASEAGLARLRLSTQNVKEV